MFSRISPNLMLSRAKSTWCRLLLLRRYLSIRRQATRRFNVQDSSTTTFQSRRIFRGVVFHSADGALLQGHCAVVAVHFGWKAVGRSVVIGDLVVRDGVWGV